MKKLIYILLVGLSTSVFAQHPISLLENNITDTSAYLSWDADTCTGVVNLQYRISGTTWGSGGTIITNVSSPYLFTGLTDNTTYDWRVKCLGTPGWSPAVNFTTPNCKITNTDIQLACDSLIWIDGNTYTSNNNTATYTVTNITGCDSIFYLDLTVKHTDSSFTYITECDSYDWNGTTYDSSGVYYETFSLIAPEAVSTLNYCNSAPNTADFTGAASFPVIEDVTLLGDITDITNNTGLVPDYYEDYTATMYADLTEGQPYAVNVTLNGVGSTLGSAPLSAGKVYIDFNIDGDFDDPGEEIGSIPHRTSATLGNSVSIPFTVPSTGVYGATRMRVVSQSDMGPTNAIDMGPCDYADPAIGWSSPFFGTTEDYSIVLKSLSYNSCDSTAVLNLIINNPTTGASSITACDSVSWEGQTINTSGDLVHTYPLGSVNGCDSTHTLSVTIELGGCTDPTAINYDSNADCDNGTCIVCTETTTQELNGFIPNTLTTIGTWAYDTLSITNNGNCDINIRPEFTISLNNGAISQGDFKIKYEVPELPGSSFELPYNIDANGNAYGFFGGPFSSPTGIILTSGANQSVFIQVKFLNTANHGEYTAIWNTKEVDDITGNVIQTLSENDTTILNYVNCNIFQPYTSFSNISCSGDSNGSALIDSIANGSGNYNYSWINVLDPGNILSPSSTITALSSGDYSCTIIDANWNCSETATFTITEPNDFIIVNDQTNLLCFEDSSGIATVSVTEATSPYSYIWSNGDTTNTATGLAEGTYTCNITDANFCDTTISFAIIQPADLTSSYTQTNVRCWGENNGSAIVNFFGGTTESTPGDTSYILGWEGLLTALLYPITEFQTTTVAPLPPGVYPYTVTDLNDCTINDTIIITQPDSLYTGYTTGSYSGFEISCYGSNDGEIDILITGGTPPFDNYLNDILQSSLISNNLFSGTYTGSIVDANGCTATNTIILTEPAELIPILTPFDISCNGLCDGEITSNISGGVLPYSYEWSNLQITDTAAGLCTGNYSLSVTDMNNCIEDVQATISEPPVISVSDSTANITTYGGTDGYIYISSSGGSGLLSTNWTSIDGFTSISEDILNLSASTYYLEIIDTNSCIYLDTLELTQPSSLSLNIDSVIYTSCYDSCNGSINVTANGGDSTYTYSWVNILDTSAIISINDDISDLCYGEYIITVDDGDTTLIDTINIYQPQPITTILSVDSILCYNGTAQAELNVWGGTQPFTYNWSNGGNSYITTISHGTHSINVVDTNGCSFDTSVTLANPDSISTQIAEIYHVDCFGGNNGSVSINITNGGTSPYTFSNDNGATYQSSNTFNNLSAGNYFFLISDDNNCLGSASVEVTEPSEIISTTTEIIDASCYLECDGNASTTAAGGTAPYSYLWTNGDSTQTATDLCAGFYSITITDANGCLNTNSAIINEPNPLLINVWIDGNNVVATSGFSSYQWYDNNDTLISGDTNSIFTPAGAGAYYVSVSDANGCTANSYIIEYNISSLEDYSLITKIFPNPTNGNITINSEYAIKSISVYNSIGNQLLSVNNNENSTTETKLDLSTFAKGVYSIKINLNNQIINQRIILQ